MIFATKPVERAAIDSLIREAKADQRRRDVEVIRRCIERYSPKGSEYEQHGWEVLTCAMYTLQDEPL